MKARKQVPSTARLGSGARLGAWVMGAVGSCLATFSHPAQGADHFASPTSASEVQDDAGDPTDGDVGAGIGQRDLRRPPRPDPTDYRSEQVGAVEVRFGSYDPKVDDEFDGAASPYEDLFGTSQRYLIGLELDWQVLRIPYLGTLGPGVSAAYTRSTGRAPFTNQDGFSDERTSLWIVPISALAVLRVDALPQRFGIPLVPYAKAGFVYALWGSRLGDDSDRAGDVAGRGAETGYQAAVGLMFWLNVLHPQSALDMDNATGINNSYVFGELMTSDVDSFGSGMQVGTDSWIAGLAFEF